MAKFRVKAGIHVQNGRIYHGPKLARNGEIITPGEIIDTASLLTESFPHKFERVADDATASTGSPMQQATQPIVPVSPDLIPESLAALKSPNDGRFIENTAARTTSEPVVTKVAVDDVPAAPTGKDVTESFAKAADQDFKVFKRAGLYFVYDTDNMAAPLNSVGVKKTGVDAIVDAALLV